MILKYETKEYGKEIKKFYLKESDPTYNKLCKIHLMQINCNKENFADVVNEFSEYLRDPTIVDAVMDAFNAIILAMELSEAKVIVKTLNDVVVNSSEDSLICNSAIQTIRTFLRKYPEEFRIFEHTLYTYVRGVSTTRARCAMVEIIGDFGEHIENAV